MSAPGLVDAHPVLRLAMIGAGDGSATLARNFAWSADWRLVAIWDQDRSRAETLALETGGPSVVTAWEELFERPDIDAVVITAPVHAHREMAMQAIAARKHVLLTGPLADATDAGAEIVAAAEAGGTVLMAANAQCHTPAVDEIRELIADGGLGEIQYIDSIRINLGVVHPAKDVFWDLAHHDLSILDYVLPGGLQPQFVAAQGADPLRAGKACVGYLSLPLPNGAMAHVHANWLSPTRIERMVIGGSRKTLVWDDLDPQQRISIHDSMGGPGDREAGQNDAGQIAETSYRLENAWAPALSDPQPFSRMASLFAAAIRDGEPVISDGRSALRVLSVLEAATASLGRDGTRTDVADPWIGDRTHALASMTEAGSDPGPRPAPEGSP